MVDDLVDRTDDERKLAGMQADLLGAIISGMKERGTNHLPVAMRGNSAQAAALLWLRSADATRSKERHDLAGYPICTPSRAAPVARKAT